MILTILLQLFFIKLTLSSSEVDSGYTSSILKDNKLYVYEPQNAAGDGSSITIYTLNDGPVSKIQHKEINLSNVSQDYTPKFLDIPKGLGSGGDEDGLWLLGGQSETSIITNDLDSAKWTGQFVNDKDLKFNNKFIPVPNFKYFPKGGYTQTFVDIDNSPALYIIGGFIYSPKLRNQSYTNCFFKFDFVQNNWFDLSDLTKNELPPIANHQTINVNNNFLLVANGLSNDNTKLTPTAPAKFNQTVFNTIDTLYKFDLQTLKWSSKKIKTNLDFDIYSGGVVYGASFNLYNGKILSYASLYNYNIENYEPQLAYLDYNKWEWKWLTTKSETGVDNSLQLLFHNTLLIHDQLILIHGITNQKKDRSIYVINLKDRQFKSTLNFSGNYSKPASKLPTYIIIIIVVVSILAIIMIIIAVWLYLRYKKKLRNGSGSREDLKMEEVWSNPNKTESNGAYISKNVNVEKISSLSTSGTERTMSTNGDSDSTAVNDTMLNADYFQHEVDLKDFEEANLNK